MRSPRAKETAPHTTGHHSLVISIFEYASKESCQENGKESPSKKSQEINKQKTPIREFFVYRGHPPLLGCHQLE
jgi:hypothetical protein